MAKAWCPWCQELVPIQGNGAPIYKDDTRPLPTKRQRLTVHPNKNPDRKEPDCEGSGKDV